MSQQKAAKTPPAAESESLTDTLTVKSLSQAHVIQQNTRPIKTRPKQAKKKRNELPKAALRRNILETKIARENKPVKLTFIKSFERFFEKLRKIEGAQNLNYREGDILGTTQNELEVAEKQLDAINALIAQKKDQLAALDQLEKNPGAQKPILKRRPGSPMKPFERTFPKIPPVRQQIRYKNVKFYTDLVSKNKKSDLVRVRSGSVCTSAAINDDEDFYVGFEEFQGDFQCSNDLETRLLYHINNTLYGDDGEPAVTTLSTSFDLHPEALQQEETSYVESYIEETESVDNMPGTENKATEKVTASKLIADFNVDPQRREADSSTPPKLPDYMDDKLYGQVLSDVFGLGGDECKNVEQTILKSQFLKKQLYT